MVNEEQKLEKECVQRMISFLAPKGFQQGPILRGSGFVNCYFLGQKLGIKLELDFQEYHCYLKILKLNFSHLSLESLHLNLPSDSKYLETVLREMGLLPYMKQSDCVQHSNGTETIREEFEKLLKLLSDHLDEVEENGNAF